MEIWHVFCFFFNLNQSKISIVYIQHVKPYTQFMLQISYSKAFCIETLVTKNKYYKMCSRFSSISSQLLLNIPLYCLEVNFITWYYYNLRIKFEKKRKRIQICKIWFLFSRYYNFQDPKNVIFRFSHLHMQFIIYNTHMFYELLLENHGRKIKLGHVNVTYVK